MKLNYKRVFLVGLAFFLITMFWQCYDTIIPKILTDKFGMSQFFSGIIMALDNVLALFMLPLFGSLSDRSKSKHGRRTPFILIGTLISCMLFVGLTFADNMQMTNILSNDSINITSVASDDSDERREALGKLYDENYGDVQNKTEPALRQGEEAARNVTRESFIAEGNIDTEAEELSASERKDANKISDFYSGLVLEARQDFAWQQTITNPAPLILFIVLLFFVLLSMSTFRSPAVALMPDVTPKPLRSKANAVINLMGTLAGAIVLGLGIGFGTGKVANSYMSYTVFFSSIAGLMLIALAVFMFTVKEKKWSEEATLLSESIGIEDKAAEIAAMEHRRHLSKSELRSLILILASVALWFIGYNAVTSKYSVYAGDILGLDYNTTLIVALGVATIAFLPVGFISSKLGRRRVILGGIVLLTVAFFVASFLGEGSPMWLMNLLFAMAGIGWASINVNSFPMVVELATGSDVGRYTGFYYAASMSAQIIAPVLSGFFLDQISMKALFPFGAVFVALSFVTMLFVRHGDAKPMMKKSILENMDDID